MPTCSARPSTGGSGSEPGRDSSEELREKSGRNPQTNRRQRAGGGGCGCGLNLRTSWGQPHASATLAAHIVAVSSSGTSTSAKPPSHSLVSTYGPSLITVVPVVGSAW